MMLKYFIIDLNVTCIKFLTINLILIKIHMLINEIHINLNLIKFNKQRKQNDLVER